MSVNWPASALLISSNEKSEEEGGCKPGLENSDTVVQILDMELLICVGGDRTFELLFNLLYVLLQRFQLVHSSDAPH
jgi:hypothetical protein